MLIRKILLGIGCILALFTQTAAGQELERRLIITDDRDSVLSLHSSPTFDLAGNYRFQVKKENQDYYLTTSGKTGPFPFIGSTFGSEGGISYTSRDTAPDSSWYYANPSDIRLYGPVKGKMEYYTDGSTRNNMALILSRKDSLFTYINGALVQARKAIAEDKWHTSAGDWCAFSPSGNALYSLDVDSGCNLYLNDRYIAHTPGGFSALHVNDRGDYLYATGGKPANNPDYDYWFFIHTKDTVLGPVRTVWQHAQNADGSYYFTGDDNGTSYVVVNNHLFKGLSGISNIQTPDPYNYLFTASIHGKKAVWVNGKQHPLNYDRIYYPALDTSGHFALYGLRDYYLYRYVDGRERDSLSDLGVRATPLYISPSGSSFHLFSTDDSVYVYHDSNRIFHPFSSAQSLRVENGASFFDNDRRDEGEYRPLVYLETASDTTGYFIYNGRLSAPLGKVFGSRYIDFASPQFSGQILAGSLDNNDFFMVQQVGPGQYRIFQNSTDYTLVTGPEKLVPGSIFWNAGTPVIYGTVGNSFYRFTLKNNRRQ